MNQNERVNIKGLIGTYAFLLTSSALNMTSGILAYIMITYSDQPPTSVAMLMTIPAIVGTFFAFISGSLVNRYGVKKLTLFAHITQFLSGMMFLFFGNKTHLFVLYAASAIYGFSLGGATVIQAQLFKENVPDESQRGQYLAYGSSIKSLGGVAMSTLGGMIAAVNNGAHWERAYLLYLFMILCIVLEVFCLKDQKSEGEAAVKKKEKSTARLPIKVWLISIHYLFYFLFLYVFSLNISEYVITTHSLGTSAEAGLCLSALTVGGIISGVFYGPMQRILKGWMMPVLLAVSASGIAMIVFLPNIILLYIASTIIGFAMMGTGPYVTIEMSRLVKGDAYTKAMSVYSGFMNGGMMFAVYILAFLAMFFFHDANSVDGKFVIAFVGNLIVFLTSIPLYVVKKKA